MNPQAVIPKVYSFKMESILNVKTQKIEAADYWLSQGKSILQKLETSLTEKRKQYACPCCKMPVLLKQNKRRLPYFAHPVIEDAEDCKLCAAKVKVKKKTDKQLAANSVSDVATETTNQEANPKARIIAFHPDYSNWDSSLGVSSINYFVTSNDIPAINDTTDNCQEFDDTFPTSIQESLDAHNWEQVNFEFLQDEQETVPSSYHVWDEDLNIQWLLDRFNGNFPADYQSIEDQDLVKLIFEQKLSRSINNLRTRILDLKICGFKLPENILDIMVDKGLIKRLEETSQVQFERAS